MPENDQTPSTGKDGQLSSSLIGSAAAGITLAVAFIYAAGAATLAFRLGFTHLPWESVIGQLPNTLLIADGFGHVVLPAAIIGMLGAVLLNYLVHGGDYPSRRGTVIYLVRGRLQHYLRTGPGIRHFIAWLGISLVLGAIQGAITILFYVHSVHKYQSGGGFIEGSLVSPWAAFRDVAIVGSIAVAVALILMPPPISDKALDDADLTESLAAAVRRVIRKGQDAPVEKRFAGRKPWTRPAWLWRALVGALITFAVIPGVAGISASTLFPFALFCPAGKESANLIAISNGWAYLIGYIVQTDPTGSPVHDKNGNEIFKADYLRLVQVSSIPEFSVGPHAAC